MKLRIIPDNERQVGEPYLLAAVFNGIGAPMTIKAAEVLEESTPTPETIDPMELAEAACCIWECMLENAPTADPTSPFVQYRDANGASATRMLACDLAENCHRAWEIAQTTGWDDSFDWEFVPRYMSQIIDPETLNPRPDWQAIAANIGTEYVAESDQRIADAAHLRLENEALGLDDDDDEDYFDSDEEEDNV